MLLVQRRKLDQVEHAGQLERMVTIRYAKKNGDTVNRTIRPYEIKPHRHSGTLMLYGTDTLHGAGNIHSFIASRVREVGEPEGRFKPRWPIKLGEE